MNIDLLLPVRPEISLLGILGYALFSFAFVLVLTPWFVSFLLKNRIGKQLRVETLDGREPTIFRTFHQNKHGTPTMGGILIWVSIVLTVLASRSLALFDVVDHSLLQRGQVYLPLFMLISLGILGGIDDYLNIVGSNQSVWQRIQRPTRWIFGIGTIAVLGWIVKSFVMDEFILSNMTEGLLSPVIASILYVALLAYIASGTIVLDNLIKSRATVMYKKGGISATSKLASLLFIGLLGGLWFYFRLGYNSIDIPHVGEVVVGAWYIPIFIFILVGTANAVNFTDGLDGLAGGLLVIAFAAFGILAYAQDLFILSAFCAVCMGAIAAFLWHNVPPALFFMGDTGSMALGGALAVMAMMIDDALILPIVGFVFVLEMLSVIIQLTSKRLRGGKKVFLAAPIHHHFEALGWGESKVTMRLWIIGLFMAFLGIIVGLTS